MAGTGNAPPAPPPEELPLVLAPRAHDDLVLVEGPDSLTFNLFDNDAEHGATVSSFDASGATGQVSVSPQGVLSYTPPPGGASFQESFTYTLSNESGSSTARVTLKRSPALYVDNRARAGGDGSKDHPFQTLKQALDLVQDGREIQIYVNLGDGTFYGAEVGVANLQTGQSLTGWDGSPSFLCQFQLASLECALTNVLVQPTASSGPAVKVIGNAVPTRPIPPMVIKNVIVANCAEDGIELDAPSNTELTKVSVFKTNLSGGTAAVLVSNPLGTVTAKNLDISTCQLQGFLVQNDEDPQLGPITVELNDLTLQLVNNAVAMDASAGTVLLSVDGAVCPTDDLSGALIGGDISGNANASATLSGLDLRTLGPSASVLNWAYAGASTGILRLGSTTNENLPGRSNPLLVTSSSSALPAFLSFGSHLGIANPVTVNVASGGHLSLRYQFYHWTPQTLGTTSYTVNNNGTVYGRFLAYKNFFNAQYYENFPDHFNGEQLTNLTFNSPEGSTTYLVDLDAFNVENPQNGIQFNGFGFNGPFSTNRGDVAAHTPSTNFLGLPDPDPHIPEF